MGIDVIRRLEAAVHHGGNGSLFDDVFAGDNVNPWLDAQARAALATLAQLDICDRAAWFVALLLAQGQQK